MLENLVDEISEATEMLGTDNSIETLTDEDEEVLRIFFRHERNFREYLNHPKYSFFDGNESSKHESPKEFVINFKDINPEIGDFFEALYCGIVNYIKEIASETSSTSLEVAGSIEGANGAIRRTLPKRENYELVCNINNQMRLEFFYDLISARESSERGVEKLRKIPFIGNRVYEIAKKRILPKVNLAELPSREVMESLINDETAYVQRRADVIYGD